MFAFSFVAIGPFLAEMWQIPYLTLKIQGEGHDENPPKSNQVICGSGPSILPKIKIIWKVVQKLSHEQDCGRQQRRRRTNWYKNIVNPSMLGWFD